jgi:hypothetical protein
MKNILLLTLLSFLLFSCEKFVEDVQEEAIAETISKGQWKVSLYTKAGTDLTSDFGAYVFQFQKNNTVDAIKNNVVEKTGTWQANATDYTITSQFDNAAYPLPLLNGTWNLTDATDNQVVAHKTVNGELYNLKLSKQ